MGRATRKTLKDTSCDEIKLAGMEALVLEYLANRLRTPEDAASKSRRMWRRSLVCESAIPSQVNRELEDTLIQRLLARPILLHLARQKGKESSSPRHGCESAVETPVTQRFRNGKKGSQSKSWSEERRTKVMEMENPREHTKVARVLKVGKTARVRKLVCLALKNQNQRQVKKHRKLHRRIALTLLGVNDRWSCGEWNGMKAGVRLAGMAGRNPMPTHHAHSSRCSEQSKAV